MGDKFLPDSVNDLLGPLLGTLKKARALAENEAGIVDQLRNLSTGLGGPLKALESAANGMPIRTAFEDPDAFFGALGDEKAIVTNPYKKLRSDTKSDDLSNLDLVMMGVGGSPIKRANIFDASTIARFDTLYLDRVSNRYMNKVADAYRAYMPHDRNEFFRRVSDIRRDASEEGLIIMPQSMRMLLRDLNIDRTTRTLLHMRRQQRPEFYELTRGLQ